MRTEEKANHSKAPMKLKVNLWFESRDHFETAKKLMMITGLSKEDFVRHAVERELNRVGELIKRQLVEQQEAEQKQQQVGAISE